MYWGANLCTLLNTLFSCLQTPQTKAGAHTRKQCTGGPTFAPSSTRSSAVYRRLKRRLGRTLRGLHCKRRLVSHRKSPSHKLLGTEGSPPGPEEIRASVQGHDCSCCDGQYNSGLLHQQAGRYEVRLSVCPPLEAPILVPSQGNCPEGKAYSRSLECDSGLAFQTQSSDPEWSLSQQVFNLLCSKWAQPQVDLFATRFNHKLPQFVSPVPDPTAWAVDALSLPWGNLDLYAFPPVSLVPQVVVKMIDQGCRRMILIAPGWPNMPWFWDLVNLSVQILFTLPLVKDLVTQPFNGLVHRNLGNLNLHDWLLEPLPSTNKVSLMRWQKELRLLRESQPEPCTSQSGPFLLSDVSHTRWTSSRPL